MNPGLDGADREAEDLRDLLHAELMMIAKQQGIAEFAGQLHDGLPDLIFDLAVDYGRFGRRNRLRGEARAAAVHQDDLAQEGSALICVGRVPRNLQEPCLDRGILAECMEAVIRLDEGFLGDIIGEMRISRQEVRIPPDLVAVGLHQASDVRNLQFVDILKVTFMHGISPFHSYRPYHGAGSSRNCIFRTKFMCVREQVYFDNENRFNYAIS